MSPSNEVIAVAHVGFTTNEAALKQHAIMFSRIAIHGLGLMLREPHFVNPKFARNRARLAEAGVLFEPDLQKLTTPVDESYKKDASFLMEDANEILKSVGMSIEEMLAARNDKEKAAEIKQRSAQPMSTDPATVSDQQKLIEAERRISVNLTRFFAHQVRQIEGLHAYPTIPSGDNSLDWEDQRPEQHDVMKIGLVVPVPDEQVSWDDVLEYRKDSDFPNRFFELKEWMSEVGRGSLTRGEVGERLEMLLDRYRKLLETHQMQINWARLEAYVVTTADVLRDLDAFRHQRASTLFSIEGRKLKLLEGEMTAPGSEVAFVIQGKSMLSS